MMKKFTLNYSKLIEDRRAKIARLLAKAVNNLIEDDSDFIASIREIAEYHENVTGDFPVLTISRDDIRQKGFNPDSLDDDDMRNLSNSMSTDDLMESFWFALEYVGENDLELPELRTEIDMLYEDYKKENRCEPLYATIWLEDKGGNNQPWPETVKLTLDVDKKEDEQIYMNFDGFNDLRSWLFASIEEENPGEDSWCYDSPQHRIVFLDSIVPGY